MVIKLKNDKAELVNYYQRGGSLLVAPWEHTHSLAVAAVTDPPYDLSILSTYILEPDNKGGRGASLTCSAARLLSFNLSLL